MKDDVCLDCGHKWADHDFLVPTPCAIKPLGAKLGESVEAFFKRMVAHARATNRPLTAKHNDLLFSIKPTDNADDLCADWWRIYGGQQEK